MRTVTFPDGSIVPVLGQGTWFMGENPSRRDAEIAALNVGLDLGMTLIDTATMYGDGAAEELVGDAIAGRREEAFVVTKVLPWEADTAGVRASVRGSLGRLGMDHVDLALLHWRGDIPLEETVEGFESLIAAGEIGSWGVSNLDVDDLDDLPAGWATDQVLYYLTRRGPELDLLPRLESAHIPAMAYSPIEQARLLENPALAAIAAQAGLPASGLALAWTLRSGNVLAIPKSGNAEHVRADARAADIVLEADLVAALDAAFPAPVSKVSLQML